MCIKSVDDIKQLGTIMGIWAHPDDETYSMAGIMATAVKNGQNVICITATRGEAGVQDESRWPAKQLANIRTKESEESLAVLGVKHQYWLDYPDGGCDQVNSDDAVNKIAKLIKKFEPDSIFTFGPDGMTGHIDHKTVSAWTTYATSKARSLAAIYHATQTDEQYEIMQEADKELNIFFNIKKPPTSKGHKCDICFKMPEDIYQQKLHALRAMPSQTDAMLKNYSHILPLAVGLEAFKRYTI